MHTVPATSRQQAGQPFWLRSPLHGSRPAEYPTPATPGSGELARALNNPQLGFRPLGDLLFGLYLTLRPHPDCPTWQTHRRAETAVRDALRLLVQWTGSEETARFSQTALASRVGLHRTAVTRLLGALEAAGALTRTGRDSHGRFEHQLHWTPALVDMLRTRPGWEERLTLLWHVLRLPQDLRPADVVLRRWLLRPNGTATLATWYGRALQFLTWRRRRDQRAIRAARGRTERREQDGVEQKITPPGPPRMRKGSLSGFPNAAHTREARAGASTFTQPGERLARLAVEQGSASDLASANAALALIYETAREVGERNPAALAAQLVRRARQHRQDLTTVAASYQRAAGLARRCQARARAGQRAGVGNLAAFAIGALRRGLDEGRYPARPWPVGEPEDTPIPPAVDEIVASTPPDPEAQCRSAETFAKVAALATKKSLAPMATSSVRPRPDPHRLIAALCVEQEARAVARPTTAQLEEARQARAAGLPVPERYLAWLDDTEPATT